MADLSTGEKLADVWDKVKSISRVLVGILPGGAFRFGEQNIRGGACIPFSVATAF